MEGTAKLVRIKATTESGKTFWHTGRAGSAWVSADESEAVRLFSIEGARNFCERHNTLSGLHGLWFVACVDETEAA